MTQVGNDDFSKEQLTNKQTNKQQPLDYLQSVMIQVQSKGIKDFDGAHRMLFQRSFNRPMKRSKGSSRLLCAKKSQLI
jgi:hypothetical protein